LQQLGNGSLIFNLGHGVIKETPPEHVEELVQLVRAQPAQSRN
jgi:uroporphyrinogen decarboxylase